MAKKPERIIMFSGGKDSTYLIKFCLENNIPFDRIVFIDNGLELPCVTEWVKEVERRLGVKIDIFRPGKKLEDYFYKKITRGRFKGRIRGFPFVILRRCWISRDMKFRPADRAFKNSIRIVGICANEPLRRPRPETESGEVITPLRDAGITEDDVIRSLKEENLYPPIYDMLAHYGAKKPRSGCWLCPKCSIGWARMLYFEYPELWKKLKKLEKDSPHGWKPRTTTDELEKRFEKERNIYKPPNGEESA